MKIATVAIAYNEQRFIGPHLDHIPDWVDENLVLVSTKPWQGETDPLDKTADISREKGATVIEFDWPTEQAQRNAGQEYLSDYDWVIVLDPDEFLDDANWDILQDFLRPALTKHQRIFDSKAYVCLTQRTYWKKGYVIEPPEDYKQIIAVRPSVRFVDKRVVGSNWGHAPILLHHFSWARTNEECLSKISHYGHAHELNPNWYKQVWLTDQKKNLHPLTPESLKKAVPVKLPSELERLKLWPTT